MGNQTDGSSPEPKSFEQLFEEMNDLLHLVIEKIESPDLDVAKKFDQFPPDIGQKLAALETDVNAFTEINKKIVSESVLTGTMNESTEHLTKREQKCLERSKKLINQAEEIQKRMPSGPLPASDISNTEKERKKHLKRIRRGQTWKL